MKGQTYVIGDIHGGYKALDYLFKQLPQHPDNVYIFLGDYVDGWSESDRVLDFLIELNTQHHCIFIKGNHDELFLNYLTEGIANPMWLHHGGQITIDRYKNIDPSKINIHKEFLQNKLVPYHLDSQNRLFIHAGFTNYRGVKEEYYERMYYWDRTLWETALSLDNRISENDNRFPNRLKLYKEIYIGHTPTTRIEKTEPVNIHCIWNLDTGAAYKGPLTAICVESKQFWQSQPVYLYYKTEKGRN